MRCHHGRVPVAESPIRRGANLHKVTSLNVSYPKIFKAFLLGDKASVGTHCAFRCPVITKMVLHNQNNVTVLEASIAHILNSSDTEISMAPAAGMTNKFGEVFHTFYNFEH